MPVKNNLPSHYNCSISEPKSRIKFILKHLELGTKKIWGIKCYNVSATLQNLKSTFTIFCKTIGYRKILGKISVLNGPQTRNEEWSFKWERRWPADNQRKTSLIVTSVTENRHVGLPATSKGKTAPNFKKKSLLDALKLANF